MSFHKGREEVVSVLVLDTWLVLYKYLMRGGLNDEMDDLRLNQEIANHQELSALVSTKSSEGPIEFVVRRFMSYFLSHRLLSLWVVLICFKNNGKLNLEIKFKILSLRNF